MRLCSFPSSSSQPWADPAQYCFFIFDKDKNGYIDQHELRLFIEVLHSQGVKGNIATALKSVDYNDDGKFSFGEFREMNRNFPQVLYPAFRLQMSMMSKVGGMYWWRRKKRVIGMKIELQRDAHLRKKESDARALRKREQDLIKQSMGIVQYYLLPYRRKRFAVNIE